MASADLIKSTSDTASNAFYNVKLVMPHVSVYNEKTVKARKDYKLVKNIQQHLKEEKLPRNFVSLKNNLVQRNLKPNESPPLRAAELYKLLVFLSGAMGIISLFLGLVLQSAGLIYISLSLFLGILSVLIAGWIFKNQERTILYRHFKRTTGISLIIIALLVISLFLAVYLLQGSELVLLAFIILGLAIFLALVIFLANAVAWLTLYLAEFRKSVK